MEENFPTNVHKLVALGEQKNELKMIADCIPNWCNCNYADQPEEPQKTGRKSAYVLGD